MVTAGSPRITDLLRLAQRRITRRQSPRGSGRRSHAVEGSIRQDLRGTRVVGDGIGECIVQKRDRRGLVGSMRASELEEGVGPLHARGNLLEELIEDRHRALPLSGEAVKEALDARRRRTSAGSSGVNRAASAQSSAAAAVAPRAAACSVAASSWEAANASGPSTDSAM